MRLPRRIESAADWLRFELPARFDRRLLIAGGALLLVAVIALLIAVNPFGGSGKGETKVISHVISWNQYEGDTMTARIRAFLASQ